MIKQFVLLGIVALLTACPINGDGPGNLSNEVQIQNVTSNQADEQHQFDVVMVSIDLSGSGMSDPMILSDVIPPGEPQSFCCFADGTYNVTIGVAFKTGLEQETSATNVVFVGPRTHVLQAASRSLRLIPIDPIETEEE